MKHLYRICIALCAWLALAAPHTLRAQEKCGTMERDAELRRQYPQEMGTLEDMELWIAEKRLQMATRRDFDQVLRVPVVVHVIHNGEAVGAGRNISDAQVLSQIKVLNQDYRRIAGTRGSAVSHPDAVDTKIEFVLARRDPQGRPTNGIDRVDRNQKGWTAPPHTSNYTDANIKPGSVWDANRYLNFWCVDFGNGLFGYAQFPPSSGLFGMNCNTGSATTDGVAINTTAFGSLDDGPFNLDPASAYGRTLSHELGHYFSLRHIWGDGQCGTDYCEDTPVHRTANRNCPTHPKPNNCGTPDEMFENYMDYTDDNCVGIFTRDQAVRMRAVLLDGPRRVSLLTSPALTGPLPNELSLAAIESPNTDVCSGAMNVRVRFSNTGTRSLTAATLNAYIDGNLQTVAGFSGRNLGFNIADTFTIPNVQIPAGRHTLRIIATAPNGTADSARGDTIEMPVYGTGGRTLPFVENFEVATAFPLDWFDSNPNNDCYQWRIQTLATGTNGAVSAAAYVPLYNVNGQNQVDNLFTPLIDLTNESSASLSFRYAHARTNTNDLTQLRVEVSEDCGETFSGTTALMLTGTDLLTGGAVNGSSWIPTDANQWRTANVSLAPYLGRKVRLKFTVVNGGGGNNVFVDNIGIERSVSQAPEVTAFQPDTAVAGDTITLIGRNLSSLVEVGFQQNRRTNGVVYASDSMVQVVVPTGAVTGALRVTTLGGTVTTARNLVIVSVPSITAFSPGTGSGGTSVTITGTGFLGVRQVLFNGLPAPLITASTATSITVLAPAAVTTGYITVIGRFGRGISRVPFIVGPLTTITNSTVSACGMILADPGGLSNYGNNQNFTMTVNPLPGNVMRAHFLQVDLESGYDFLYVYDGPSATGSPIATITNRFVPADITATSTSGALTFKFQSDNSETYAGFIAELSCLPRSQPDILRFNPMAGNAGTRVLIEGPSVGLSDSVWFNGLASTSITRVSHTQVLAIVPEGATTGPIRVRSIQYGSDVSQDNFTILNIPSHCTPLHPNCAADNSFYISRVAIAGTSLSNSSACAAGAGTEGYTFYSRGADSTSTSLKAGGVYLLSVNTNGNSRVGAWLDWDRDGNFEANEFYAIPQSANASERSRILVRIPAGADTGLTVLRIRAASTAQTLGANDFCASRNSGEAEDYVVRIMGNCGALATPDGSGDTTLCRNAMVDLAASSAGVRWYSDLREPWVAAGASYTAGPISKNTTVYLVAEQDNCESAAKVINLTLNAPLAGFTITGNTLEAISQGAGYTYRWFLGGLPIAGATDATYTISAPGTYSLQLTYNGCTSLTTGQPLVLVSAAVKLSANLFRIWPNPTRGQLNIEAAEKGVFTLTDAMGREVYRSGLAGGKKNLALPALSSGIYAARYITGKGVSTHALEVE